jgi:hypothetical protein
MPKKCPAKLGIIPDGRGGEYKYCLYVRGYEECLRNKDPTLVCNL